MPAPLAPIALNLLRIGAVAAIGYYATRKIQHLDQTRDEAHDRAENGVFVSTYRDGRAQQLDSTARMQRHIRLGKNGPGLSIDATALGRIKISRI